MNLEVDLSGSQRHTWPTWFILHKASYTKNPVPNVMDPHSEVEWWMLILTASKGTNALNQKTKSLTSLSNHFS